MVVRIRLKRGPKVRRTRRKNRHVALALAVLLTPAALMAFVLCLWRVGADIGFARSFVIPTGMLSHWQVWLALALGLQFVAVMLNRYGRPEPEPKREIKDLKIPAKHTVKEETLVDSR